MSAEKRRPANVLALLETNHPRPETYRLLERVILRLLDRRLLDGGGGTTIMDARNGRSAAFNALISGGVDHLPGPTGVDIYFARSLQFLQRVEERIPQLLQRAADAGLRSLLLIVVGTPGAADGDVQTTGIQAAVHRSSARLSSPITVTVWTNAEIERLLDQYPEAVSDLLPELAEAGVSKLVRDASHAEEDEWKKAREQLLARVTQAYHDHGIFLFLGAGCSLDAGLPGWDALIHRLLVRLVENRVELGGDASDAERRSLARTLGLVESSPLLAARYTRAGLGDAFEAAVREVLYEDVSEDRIGDSELLRQIARMCAPRTMGVRGIITYNFDDLLETHLEDIGVPFEAIWNDKGTVSERELPVFHVHGFLPRSPSWRDENEGLLVFSEEGYHRLLNDPNYWANVVQLNYLRERTCLFVGLSVTDPNLRRILEVVRPATVDVARHYILLKRLGTDEFLGIARDHRIELNPEHGASVLRVHHKLQQDSLQKLGLNIIWYEEYAEVPRLLHGIRRRAD